VVAKNRDEREACLRMLVLDGRRRRPRVDAVEGGEELSRIACRAAPALDLLGRDGALWPDSVVDRDRAREVGVVFAQADGSRLNCVSTYGGDLVSTWSVLRRSCKPRFRRPR
jgi:hypothetical protein